MLFVLCSDFGSCKKKITNIMLAIVNYYLAIISCYLAIINILPRFLCAYVFIYLE